MIDVVNSRFDKLISVIMEIRFYKLGERKNTRMALKREESLRAIASDVHEHTISHEMRFVCFFNFVGNKY